MTETKKSPHLIKLVPMWKNRVETPITHANMVGRAKYGADIYIDFGLADPSALVESTSRAIPGGVVTIEARTLVRVHLTHDAVYNLRESVNELIELLERDKAQGVKVVIGRGD